MKPKKKKKFIHSDVLQLLEGSIRTDDEMEEESSFPEISLIEFPFKIELENENQQVL